MSSRLLFSTVEVTRQVFYRSSLTFAIVNLKPIVPGHVLVCPTRSVPRLADLTPPELSSLMLSVQQVGNVIERVYGADGLTIACQDGKAAGQSVPHVHFHLLPRKTVGDHFSNNDDIYPVLEAHEGTLHAELHEDRAQAGVVPPPTAPVKESTDRHEPLKVDADEARKPRSMEEMEKEATWLKTFFDGEAAKTSIT